MNIRKFQSLNVSSKFAICGLPIRMDTYRTCSFGCQYCFANGREIMKTSDTLQVGNTEYVRRILHRVFDLKEPKPDSLLENLIARCITWHCGGMSDPFQPAEGVYHVTKDMVDLCNAYDISILFSTKTDSLYDVNIRPDLHTFQLSVTNVHNDKTLEPHVPDIRSRYALYKALKADGYRVGIRIQPFIPGVTTTEIVDLFHDADNFTIEGLKLVPQNLEQKQYLLELLHLNSADFKQMGLLTLRPELRLEMYKPFIQKLERYGIPYSISDNDLRGLGTNHCCCGDRLVTKASGIDTTALIQKYGESYLLKNAQAEILSCGIGECSCNQLFSSNRQVGFKTVADFYALKFDKKSHPLSPSFQYREKSASENLHKAAS